MFLVSEIFSSIQGEGIDAGRPAIFVRLSGCNLRCKFGNTICDTPYCSYQPSGEKMSETEIVDAVKKYPQQLVVITGGEPLIQKPEKLAAILEKMGKEVAFETNGTFTMPPGFKYICSPKLENAKNEDFPYFEEIRKTALDNVKNAIEGNVNIYLKFVYSGKKDEDEINLFVKNCGIDKDRVFIMPEGISNEQIIEKGRGAWQFALEEGFRYCSRYQVQLFGNERGK